MKLFLLRPNQQSCHQLYGTSMALRALLFSTQAPPIQPSPITQLKRMIMRAGDPKASVVPILENWVQQGNKINRSQVLKIIRDLRGNNRFSPALQMLEWMGDKGGYELSVPDFAIQLELTSIVHGIEQAERYFDVIPHSLRVYRALLRCYLDHGCLGKAEATMQKLRELGLLRDASPYNIMLAYYYKMREVGYADVMELLAEEMREKRINKDEITCNILLKVYGENLLIEKMEELLTEMKADPHVSTNSDHYYLRNNLRMLEKSEESREGNLNEVYRSMIRYLSGKHDMDGAERFWEGWLSKRKEMDFGIPQAMIYGYGRNGQWEKAEAFVFRMRESGIEPDADTIYSLASAYQNAYVECKQMDKAVEASMKAISVSEPGWIPVDLYIIDSCFMYLTSRGDDVAKEELYNMLKEHSGLPAYACHDLKKCDHMMGCGFYKDPRSCFS